jgi:hypothetical protein
LCSGVELLRRIVVGPGDDRHQETFGVILSKMTSPPKSW